MDLGGHRGVSEEDSVDEGQQPVGDALAQPPPGPPKAAPLPPLLHNCSELPECSPHQEQQQGWGQAWGGTGGVRGGHRPQGNTEGSQGTGGSGHNTGGLLGGDLGR